MARSAVLTVRTPTQILICHGTRVKTYTPFVKQIAAFSVSEQFTAVTVILFSFTDAQTDIIGMLLPSARFSFCVWQYIGLAAHKLAETYADWCGP